MKNQIRYSHIVKERAVRMVFEHEKEYPSQWAAINSIASKIGCTPETLRTWIRQAEAKPRNTSWNDEHGTRSHEGVGAKRT